MFSSVYLIIHHVTDNPFAWGKRKGKKTHECYKNKYQWAIFKFIFTLNYKFHQPNNYVSCRGLIAFQRFCIHLNSGLWNKVSWTSFQPTNYFLCSFTPCLYDLLKLKNLHIFIWIKQPNCLWLELYFLAVTRAVRSKSRALGKNFFWSPISIFVKLIFLS